MKAKRVLCCLLGLILMLSLFTGCGKKNGFQSGGGGGGGGGLPITQTEPDPNPATEPNPAPTPEPEPEPEPFRNPLTGEITAEDLSAQRPYAVMINNISVALPQYGISKADIIYEVVAEGGITRMLGVFQDVRGIGPIGSIRSARPYYIDLTQGHDAVYVHAGGSPQAYTDLRNKGIDHVDGVSGNTPKLFYRDQARIRNAGYEHSMFTTGELLTEICGTLPSIRHTHNDDWKYPQTFADDATPKGEDAPLVRAYFPDGGKQTTFEYDAESRQYKVFEYGSAYVDGSDGKQVSVTNVLCLFTDVSRIRGDDKGRMAVRTTGAGSGIFICGGKATEINWERPNVTDPFVYKLKDGTPLTLGVGHSFVCILRDGCKVTLNDK